MKKILPFALFALAGLLFTGCAAGEKIVGKNVQIDDITEFYWTYENINYNAHYQRYRFYVEDGKHMFYHVTRDRKDDYGPCSEEDTVKEGTFELSEEEWNRFFDLLTDGTVVNRKDSADSGDSGPWTYLYWKNDKGECQQYSFVSYERGREFETFCMELADR